MKRKLVVVFILVCIGASALFLMQKNRNLLAKYSLGGKQTTFIFVGDIMLSRQIEKIVYREQDPLYHFLIAKDVTSGADITFANLEGPVSTRGVEQGSMYSFRMHPDLLKGLTYGGFDIVSIANNHSFDWGSLAYTDTMDHLQENGILFTGGGKTYADAHKATRVLKNGETFCFLGYTEFASQYVSNIHSELSMNKLDVDIVKKDIAQAKKEQCGPIIISIHWGNEYEVHPRPDQVKTAHEIIDAGALMVIGHHPHVVQDVEEYHGGLIAYSLGNFVFDQNFSSDTKQGLLLKVKVKNNSISNIEKIRVHFTDTFQPVPEMN